MHEYAIAQELVGQVKDVASEYHARKVTRVVVQVGRLRGIVPDVLKWGFEVTAADTVAAGAQLDIEVIPIRVRCRSCGAESELDEPLFICPACNGFDVMQLSGSELILKSVEIEDDRDSSITERTAGQ